MRAFDLGASTRVSFLASLTVSDHKNYYYNSGLHVACSSASIKFFKATHTVNAIDAPSKAELGGLACSQMCDQPRCTANWMALISH